MRAGLLPTAPQGRGDTSGHRRTLQPPSSPLRTPPSRSPPRAHLPRLTGRWLPPPGPRRRCAGRGAVGVSSGAGGALPLLPSLLSLPSLSPSLLSFPPPAPNAGPARPASPPAERRTDGRTERDRRALSRCRAAPPPQIIPVQSLSSGVKITRGGCLVEAGWIVVLEGRSPARTDRRPVPPPRHRSGGEGHHGSSAAVCSREIKWGEDLGCFPHVSGESDVEGKCFAKLSKHCLAEEPQKDGQTQSYPLKLLLAHLLQRCLYALNIKKQP